MLQIGQAGERGLGILDEKVRKKFLGEHDVTVFVHRPPSVIKQLPNKPAAETSRAAARSARSWVSIDVEADEAGVTSRIRGP